MATATFVKTAKLLELLHLADPLKSLYVSTADGKLRIGPDPFNPSAMIDLSLEEVVPFERDGVSVTAVEEVAARRQPRKGGEYWAEFDGIKRPANSLKGLLAAALTLLELRHPGTLKELSEIKLRSRRIVAQDPNDLFEKPELVKNYAEKLQEGWWYGTNNSATETRNWIERACLAAGVRYGVDLTTNLTPELRVVE